MFFLTGSSVFGPFIVGSDIDIVMMDFTSIFLRKLIEVVPGMEVVEGLEKGDLPSKQAGFYFRAGNKGRVINVITIFCEDEYKAWQKATDEMRRRPVIFNKEERVKLFEELLDKEW